MAVFNIQIPNVKTLDLNDGETQRSVLNFLFELSDKLNYALNNLDFGNFDKETYIDLSNLRSDSENLNNVVNSLAENTSADNVRIYNELRDMLIAKADELTADYSNQFRADAQRMDSQYTEINNIRAGVDALSDTFDSQLTQTAHEIRAEVSAVSEIVTGNKEEQDTFRNEVNTYIRFSVDGLELGKADSNFKTTLTNDRLSFLQGGSEVAYISNNKLYITDANVTGTLTVGNNNTGYYDWILESNNSLSLARRP